MSRKDKIKALKKELKDLKKSNKKLNKKLNKSEEVIVHYPMEDKHTNSGHLKRMMSDIYYRSLIRI